LENRATPQNRQMQRNCWRTLGGECLGLLKIAGSAAYGRPEELLSY